MKKNILKKFLILLTVTLSGIFFSPSSWSQSTQTIETELFKEGDIIFHQSMSGQSQALREITQSVWTHVGVLVMDAKSQWHVAEAISTVRATPLKDFIRRGRDFKVIVMRLKPDLVQINSAQVTKLKMALLKQAGKNYDYLFRWENETIYCSELVWKVFQEAFDVELSVPEKFSDFDLSGPAASRMRSDRYTSRGIEFNLKELVVTPVALLKSDKLTTIYRN